MPFLDPVAPGPAAAPATSSFALYLDADGAFGADNPAWCGFTGQSAQQAAGHGWLDRLEPAQQAPLRQVFATPAGPVSLECRLQRHDGAWRRMLLQAAPVPAGDAPRPWLVLLLDRTEALQAEAALRASAERLRVLDDIAHATRALHDPDEIMACTARLVGEYLGASRCAYADVDEDNDRFTIRNDWSRPGTASSAGVYSLDLFGETAAYRMRHGIALVVHDVDGELGDQDGGRMFNAIGIKAIICAGLVKDGRLVAMMAVHQDRPRHWSDDELQMVSEVVDRCWAHIERTRDAALLREQDLRKDEFIATLAHELRNPLAPIKYAVALAAQQDPPPALAKRLGVIDRQVSLMARLIDDLLDISRINRGLIELRRERCELRALAERSVEGAQALVEARGHQLTLAVPDGLPVEVDPARMVQVIGNLLTNAAKYSPPGSRITVEAHAAQGRAVLAVRDNGLGIPAAELGRLFRMFSQLRHTSGHSQGGLGLGLALVKRLVELHGGQVHAESPGLDQGSTFIVALPLAEPAATVAPARAPDDAARDAAAATSAGGRRLLVVEDNDDGREHLVELLRTAGYTVDAAANGPDGLAAALRQPPELVLLDLGLPGLDGVQVGQRLRQRFGPEAMALVALTGWGAAADIARTREAGFDRHLTKPVEIPALLATVRAALDGLDAPATA